jgi:hypothetical protein
MNRLHGSLILAVLLFGGPAAMPLCAEQLTVGSYFEVTLARLSLVVDTWEEAGRAPRDEEEAALFQRYEISAEAYYDFSGEHRDEMAAYLKDHSEIQQAIDDLSARIQQLVAQAEEQ